MENIPARFCVLMLFLVLHSTTGFPDDKEEVDIEGEVRFYSQVPNSWTLDTRVIVDNGEFISYPRDDGTFTLYGLPPGKYDIMVENPWCEFDTVSIRVSREATVTAWKYNPLSANKGRRLEYPLVLRERKKNKYFMQRATFSWTDLQPLLQILSFAALAIPIFLMQKYMNAAPAEQQREMSEQMKEMNKQMSSFKFPNVSVWLTKFFAPYFGPKIPPGFGEDPEQSDAPTSMKGRGGSRSKAGSQASDSGEQGRKGLQPKQGRKGRKRKGRR